MQRAVARSGWTSPPTGVFPARDEVHVWLANLDLPPASTRYLAGYLNRDERVRAARLKRATDRDRWIANRAALRLLIARYLETDPILIEFSYGTYGKPFLSFPAYSLQFNTSQSAGLALYAFTREHDVGVDLEQVQQGFDGMKLAQRLFAPAEIAMLRALPARYRQRVFLHCWTMKEAYLKARGLGRYARLDPFQVGFAARNEVRVVTDERAVTPHDWAVIPLDVTSKHVGAVAVKSSYCLVRTWLWTPPPPYVELGDAAPSAQDTTRELPHLELPVSMH